MKENVTLIREINTLRKELQGRQGEVKQLEGTLKTTRTLADMRGKPLPSKDDTLRMTSLLSGTATMAHEEQQTERIIDMQKEEIRYAQLCGKIYQCSSSSFQASERIYQRTRADFKLSTSFWSIAANGVVPGLMHEEQFLKSWISN